MEHACSTKSQSYPTQLHAFIAKLVWDRMGRETVNKLYRLRFIAKFLNLKKKNKKKNCSEHLMYHLSTLIVLSSRFLAFSKRYRSKEAAYER